MRKILGVAVAVALLSAGRATAAPVTFFGQDAGPGDGADARALHPLSDAVRTSFLSALAALGVGAIGDEGFEGFADQQAAPLNVTLSNGINAQITSGGGTMVEDPANNPSAADPTGVTNGSGRYPISGTKYLESGNTFAITFDRPLMAFGFYGVDIGDFSAQLPLTLSRGALIFPTLNVPNAINVPGAGVLYFGFYVTDPAEAFTRIEFGNTQGGNDYFGFDDISAVAAVPEPTSLVLLGTGLAALARRKLLKGRGVR